MGKLDGKVAIITGGAGGQGTTHARLFVNEGAKVVITDINVEAGEALARELGESVKFIKHDVSNESEWENVVSKTESTFGPVDILVNNAGIAPIEPLETLSVEHYQKVMNINELSVFLGMKNVLPSMKKTKNGSIINISSTAGLAGEKSSGGGAYVASKFAVRGLTKAAALEFAKYGIRVNSVHPGPIRTPMIMQEDTREIVEQMVVKITPLKRIAEPEEVSKMILFLASDDSSYSTGSEFVIDGGITAGY
ncbi:glucose 1-dehydrogenase [Psychrobacillus sp. NPDC096426]|uniref:glucose 1-dehydrogenase n=1 Tax=Psychrobacillus sp. NPDC096426 TaxID=3364491 RepID=UPI0037FFF0A3